MATLVTGGTGFIGGNIVKALALQRHEVVSYDVAPPDDLMRRFIGPWAKQVTFVEGDILDVASLERIAASHSITKIVHAAVFTAYRHDIEVEQSRANVDINIAGTANLLDLASRLQPQRFLYVSSAAVYGEDRLPGEALSEDVELRPENLYAIGKYVSELLTRGYGGLHGFDAASIRLSSHFGPMERPTAHRVSMSVPYEWSGEVVRGRPIRVPDRSQGQDYTYSTDAAEAVQLVLDAPSLPHDVYNVSAGRSFSLQEVIDALRELHPSLQVIDDPSKEFGLLPPDTERGTVDSARIKEDLGYEARFDLKAGLKDYLEWREACSFYD